VGNLPEANGTATVGKQRGASRQRVALIRAGGVRYPPSITQPVLKLT